MIILQEKQSGIQRLSFIAPGGMTLSFEKVECSNETSCLARRKKMTNAVMTVVVRGWQDARSGSGLP
jgi:hypothetical protein